MLARNVMRLAESGIDRGLVAELENVRDILRTIGPDRRRPLLHRVRGQHDRRQRLVIDLDALRRVFCCGESFRDDVSDRVADELRLLTGEAGMRAGEDRRTVRTLARHAYLQRADAVG